MQVWKRLASVHLLSAAIICLVSATAQAQPPQALNGMGGILVIPSEAIVSPQTPDSKGVVGYNIYRKTSSESAWTKLNAAPVQRSADKQAFERVLGQGFLNDLAQFYKRSPEEVWSQIQQTTARKTSKINALFLNPRAMLPFGEAFVDSTAKKGILYEYAVAPITASGEGTRESRGSAQLQVAPPEYLVFARTTLTMQDSSHVRLRSTYLMNSGALYGFEILRGTVASGNSSVDGALKPIASVLRSRGGEDPSLIFVDSTVEYGKAYRYAIAPFDAFYNKGLPRDTLTIVAAIVRDLPLAQNFLAQSTTAGIKLTWKLQRPPAPEYRGTIILRSYKQNTPDSDYVRIDTVGYATTEYLDRSVQPMDKYYYRLQTLGVDMSVGPVSTYYGAMFEMGSDKTNIPPPLNIRGLSTKAGIRLTWQPIKLMPVEGYYVYRAMSAKDSLELISKIVKDTVFVDSARHLSPYSPYYYAIATVNGSFEWGAKSERLAVRHDANARPEAPPTPSAYQEHGAVMVKWSNEAAMNPALAGYNVYRSVNGKSPEKLTPLNSTLLAANVTQFRDLKPLADETLLYTITSIDAVGKESPPSPAAQVAYRLPDLRPPSSVRAVPSGKAVTVRWSSTTDKRVTGYEVFRALKGGAATSIGTVASGVLEFVDKQVKPGEAHYYKVVAVGVKGRSAASSEVVVIP